MADALVEFRGGTWHGRWLLLVDPPVLFRVPRPLTHLGPDALAYNTVVALVPTSVVPSFTEDTYELIAPLIGPLIYQHREEGRR